MKPILAILCAVLLSSPAVAADPVLKCQGQLSEPKVDGKGRNKRAIEFSVSVSGREITLQADPKYDFGGTPTRSVLKLVVRKLDATIFQFRSVERMKRSENPLIVGTLLTKTGLITVYWREDELRTLIGDCAFLLGTRSTVLPKVT